MDINTVPILDDGRRQGSNPATKKARPSISATVALPPADGYSHVVQDPPVTLLPEQVQQPDFAPPPLPPLIPRPVLPRPKRRTRRWLKRIVKTTLALLVASELAAVSFIWVTPPRTAYMFEDGEPIVYQDVSLDHISRFMLASTIAHEDQQLGSRVGAFPLSDFTDRATAYLRGEEDPSGSTIPQQLVKNIFLWPSQDPVRKGLEAVLATQFSFTLSHQRTLELYLNYAQFGPHLYGICAASWYYFNEAPSNMTEYQSAQLMGVLPMPNRVVRAKEGGIYLGEGADPNVWQYVNGEANVHVPREIAGLGGWQAAVATVGIHDTAADHADTEGGPDGCAAMPQNVADRLKQDGFTS